MRENFPDPYLAQTGFDADVETADDLDDHEFDLEFGDADERDVDDELEIEERRARER